jgi:GT2 family glycosyltransferase
MPLIVAGMPAAGTTLVAECLRACGVRLTDACGLPNACAAGAGRAEPWGWVDAGGSLAIPVWLASDPRARVVVCLRNPLEVAASLRERHGLPLDAGLSLWSTHLTTLLETTSPANRVVVHYAAFRHDPVAATARLAAALGLPAPVDAATLRHAWRGGATAVFDDGDLVTCGIDSATIDAYRLLCAEAGHVDLPGPGPRPDRDLVRDLASACRRRRRPEATPVELAPPAATLLSEIARLRADLAARDDELRDLVDDLRHDIEDERLSPAKREYRQTIRGVRGLLRDHVPRGATVAIVSKGDEELVRQRHCVAWHFPRDQKGGYLGYHPAGDTAAIANLETVRAAGASHLLLPETHAWWLTSYPGFARHLERHARVVESRPAAGLLYVLTPHDDIGPSPGERLTAALGRPPQVLVWDAPGAAAVFSDAHLFEPPAAAATLPYIDRSIDVVAVAGPSADAMAEARRVARVAVVDVAATPAIEWIERPVVPEPPSVSIVLPVHGNWPVTEACLRGLLPSLPAGWPIEVVVVDDASTDDTPTRLAAVAETDHRLVVLRNDVNLGFVGTCNRGAAAATGDYLVFLNNDTVPLPGWLPPLVRTFRDFPTAGAVGGKLLFPDGRLQEAGGIIFADASACHFGREHPDPSWHLFNHVRSVDYVSGALLATPRELFLALGGFDPAYAPGYYEDTDYCFRLREHGHDVLMQPAATIVHFEGGTAGTDHAVGMKRFQELNRRRFQARHAAALMRQPTRPPVIDRDSWTRLAHRGAAPEAR